MSAKRDGAARVAHLIGDVQRFGLLSAATIVERYIETVDRAITDHVPMQGPPSQPEEGWLVDGAARVAQAGSRVLDTIATLIAEGGQSAEATEPERLVFPAARPGSSTEACLWIHNPTPAPETGVDLRVTALTCSSGSTIPGSAVSWSPSRVELLAAFSRQEVRLRVEIPSDQPEGLYHGLALSSAAPHEPLDLRLEVQLRAGPFR